MALARLLSRSTTLLQPECLGMAKVDARSRLVGWAPWIFMGLILVALLWGGDKSFILSDGDSSNDLVEEPPDAALTSQGAETEDFELDTFAVKYPAGEDPFPKRYAVFTDQSGEVRKVRWPPLVGEPFPNLELQALNGKTVNLAELRGEVWLLEFVRMANPASQAFAGAGKRGAFRKARYQRNLKSIREYLKEYGGGLRIGSPRFLYIQIFLYGFDTRPPSTELVREWKKHFAQPVDFALIGRKELLSAATVEHIPGFFLVDRDLTVLADSTGITPQDSLYFEVLPRLAQLLSIPDGPDTGFTVMGPGLAPGDRSFVPVERDLSWIKELDVEKLPSKK